MTKSKTWRFDHFLGIDVSKDVLDITLMFRRVYIQHYQIGNSVDEISDFVKLIRDEQKISLPTTVFGMEQTGIYCNHLLSYLGKLKANIVVQDAVHIKNSLGTIRGKNDKIDSKRIAGFLVKGRDEIQLLNVRRPLLLELVRLTSLRERLVGVNTALQTPLKEEKNFLQIPASQLNQQLTQSTMLALASDIGNIERYIESIWKNDEKLKNLMTIITSVPGVGPITALQIILTTNEFINIQDHKKFACYCGVAPFEHKSGTSVRLKSRVSNHSNRRMKTLMHICALSAKRFDPDIENYYLRRIAEGKPKMSVINAIRFKVLARIFTCVRNNRMYQKDYKPENRIVDTNRQFDEVINN